MQRIFFKVYQFIAAALLAYIPLGAAHAATVNLIAGDNLNLAIEQAASGDIILLGPGVYSAQSTPYLAGANLAQAFWITKKVTIRGVAGAAATILNSDGAFDYAVQFRPINYRVNGIANISDPSGAVLEGVTVNSQRGGIAVFDPEGEVVGGVSDVQIRNVVINADGNGINEEHALLLQLVKNNVVDNVVVNKGAASAFYILGGSKNTIINSRSNFVRMNHPIVVKNSTYAQILNNTVLQAKLEGIVLNNTQYSRVDSNTVTGFFSDGITLTDNSSFNDVVHNTVVSDAYRFSLSKPANILPGRTHGVGMWLNCGSNGNYISGNYMRGAAEVGLALYSSSNNYLLGNTVSEHYQGGILTKEGLEFCTVDVAHPPPNFNVVHRNTAVYQEDGAGFIGMYSKNNEVAFNYVSSINDTGAKLVNQGGTAGFGFVSSTDNRVYANTVFDTTYSAVNFEGSANIQYFRNRFLKTQRFEIQNAKNIKLDDDLGVGGNYWENHPTVGLPDPNRTPYSGALVTDADKQPLPVGDAIDRFTYDSETFGRRHHIDIKFPARGAIIAAGRKARIEWHAEGCTFIEIRLGNNMIIAAKAPNTGFYIWDVPLAAVGQEIIFMRCQTSTNADIRIIWSVADLIIANSSLILLAPHNGYQADAGSNMRVAWRKTDANAAVNVHLTHSGGAEILLASNVTASFADVQIPAGISTNTARVRISSATGQDSTDGLFSIRTGTGAVTSTPVNNEVLIGYVHDLKWNSIVGSTTVDLSFWDGAAYRAIIQNLPDRGSYSWFVREVAQNDSRVRVIYKNALGTVITSVDSAAMNIVYSQGFFGVEQPRYRLFNKITNAHLYTSDRNEYDVLRAFTARWADDFPAPTYAMKTFSGRVAFASVKLLPYYRLFNKLTANHYWTIDRNDYFAKRQNTITWQQEGVDSYIFPTQVTGAVPLYRMYSAALDKYLWTVDANEYTVLTTQRGWQPAGVSGLPTGVEAYVYPPPLR